MNITHDWINGVVRADVPKTHSPLCPGFVTPRDRERETGWCEHHGLVPLYTQAEVAAAKAAKGAR